jgi:hypothetical protein
MKNLVLKTYSIKIWNKSNRSLLDEKFGLPAIKVEDMVAGLVRGSEDGFNKVWNSLDILGMAVVESEKLRIEFEVDSNSLGSGGADSAVAGVPLNRTLTHLGLVSWLNAEKAKGNIDLDLDIDGICESLLDRFDCTIMRTGAKGFYVNRIYDSVNSEFKTVSVEFYGSEFKLKHISK